MRRKDAEHIKYIDTYTYVALVLLPYILTLNAFWNMLSTDRQTYKTVTERKKEKEKSLLKTECEENTNNRFEWPPYAENK